MNRTAVNFAAALGLVTALLLAFPLPVGPTVIACEVPPTNLPTSDQVLDRFVAAVGGRAALERIDVRRYRGTIVQDLAWKDPRHQEIPFVAESLVDGSLRYAESNDWTDLPEADDGEPRRKLRWLMHPRFALVVEEFFPELSVVGREIRNNRPVVVLVPAELPFEHYALYFDEETGLLNHIGYHNDLADWRRVDGVLFPGRIVFGRKGGHVTWVFEEVEAI